MNATKSYRCGCGVWTGECCSWTGPASEMVVVEWMPPELRASHEAARNSGTYPANGSTHVAVERSCADLVTEADGEWAGLTECDPAAYAEEVD